MSQLSMVFTERPKNQKAAVLKMLIDQPGVSERDTVFNGFRTRISELKREPYNLNIRTIKVPFKTQFGKASHFNKHFLYEIDKVEARKMYEKLNK